MGSGEDYHGWRGFEDGKFAKHLVELGVGDEVEVKGPYGSFVLQDSDKEAYLICAGSGVSPIMAMARQLKGNGRKLTVLQGVSYAEELGWREELEGMRDENFNYVPTVSRPEENPDWKGKTGRVEEHLEVCKSKDAEVYVCGPPPMVEKVIKALKDKGFAQVFTEKYY